MFKSSSVHPQSISMEKNDKESSSSSLSSRTRDRFHTIRKKITMNRNKNKNRNSSSSNNNNYNNHHPSVADHHDERDSTNKMSNRRNVSTYSVSEFHPSNYGSSNNNNSNGYESRDTLHSPLAFSTTSDLSTETVTVCCGCRPKAKRTTKRFRKIQLQNQQQQQKQKKKADLPTTKTHHDKAKSSSPSSSTATKCIRMAWGRLQNCKFPTSAGARGHNKYKDAELGEDLDWKPFRSKTGGGSVKSGSSLEDNDSLYFFDAVDQPLEDDYYPISGYAIRGSSSFSSKKSRSSPKYKVVFTTSMDHPAPRVSLSDPDSMLHPRSRSSSFGSVTSSLNEFEDARSDPRDDDDDNERGVEDDNNGDDEHEHEHNHEHEHKHERLEDRVQDDDDLPSSTNVDRREKARILNHKEPSARFRKIRRRTPEELTAELQKAPPSAGVLEETIGLAGYPGTLTVEELKECQKFLQGLNNLPPSVSEQIYSYRDVEDQPYTICRWLRATKFNADEILARCAENQPLFDEAKQHDFYGPDLEEHIGGCPFSVFLSQYPFLPIGRGKNGSPVNYMRVGSVNPEGIMCLITIDQLKRYYWYSFMHSFKDAIRESQKRDPDFCRCEGINVLDLSGLNASALTPEIMDVIKLMTKISDFFPETLHCMLLLNAPSVFSFSWKLIKNFIDPRTASRIQLFSSKEKGLKALEMLVDKDTEIPSDYGGGNISLREAFLRESSDTKIVRQEVELLYCKRRGRKATKQNWTLKADESIEITVYTRSIGEASIQVNLNGSTIKAIRARCNFVEVGGESVPHPSKTVAMTSLAGPGEVQVEAIDLDTSLSKAQSNLSRGFFLVVGDVKKMAKHIGKHNHQSSSNYNNDKENTNTITNNNKTTSGIHHSNKRHRRNTEHSDSNAYSNSIRNKSSVSLSGAIPSVGPQHYATSSRKVSFNFDDDDDNDNYDTNSGGGFGNGSKRIYGGSPYNVQKPSLNAKVTMTGLSLTPPIKVPSKHRSNNGRSSSSSRKQNASNNFIW